MTALIEAKSGQSVNGSVRVDEIELKARVAEILNRHPAVGLAVGVVRDGSLEFFHGHGEADVASNTPITEDTVFRVASITKTFTAIAVMQLWEQGLVDLDAPANDYLRAYQLVPAKVGFQPASIRHLLTHTAGIAEVLRASDVFKPLFGETVKVGQPLPSLAEFYRGGLRTDVEPGTRFTYTDHGPTTLGQIVEDVSGQPFACYVREHVFEPLGMTSTNLVRTNVIGSRLAIGYELRSSGARAVTDYEVVTVGGGGAYSTPRDMARYVAALLGGGKNEHGSILKPATLATMFEPQYQPDPRIPGIGLAFDRYDFGGHLVVGHGGILPGFNSQIFAAPNDGVGVIAFTNGARQAMLWLPAELSRVLNRVLGVRDDAVRTDVPQHPEIWEGLCGRYQLPGSLLDVRARLMLGAGAQVFVSGGRLVLRVLSPIPAVLRGFPLHPDDPDDPYVFRIDLSGFGLGTARLVFSRGAGEGATAVHLDLLPMSLRKQPATKGPSAWLTKALPALMGGSAIVVGRRRSTSPDLLSAHRRDERRRTCRSTD
jgi:CubicO group peptidase (beta-lactamase class C family)